MSNARLALVLVLVALIAVPSFAELGASAATVASDAAHLKASHSVTANLRYSVHEMKTESGTTVREYASPSGTVFAVSWRGQSKPDLRNLLGESNFTAYTQAASQHQVRGVHHVEVNGLIVETGGHMRDLRGRAYLADHVPSGVDLKEIQ